MAWMEGREYYRGLLVVFHIFGGQVTVGRFLLLSNVSSYLLNRGGPRVSYVALIRSIYWCEAKVNHSS
jgi:hypothetical protein